MYETPIAIFPFRRPELTERVFSELVVLKPKRLLVYIDGPRNDEDHELIQNTSKIFERIDWECNLSLVLGDKNKGLGEGYIDKIRWVFSLVDKAIFLEEDIIPNKSFFVYMEELLNYYEYDKNIIHISGTNLMGVSRQSSSYFFSKFSVPHWGWGSWARLMDTFDYSITDWDTGLKLQLRSFSIDPLFWENIFERAISRKEIWDFPWMSMIWRNQGVCIIPSANLVRNMGFGGKATFTKEKSRYLGMVSENISFPLKHPQGWDLQLAQLHETEIISWIKGIMKKQ